MSIKKQPRILIFGAGVIGCTYAIKFLEAGVDVTMLARSNRLETLKKNGLQYNHKGSIKSINIKLIEKLEENDIYDYIFVPVRYDQAESALSSLENNGSKNIVTMTNNSCGYDTWTAIVGDRLLPAFPSAGGQIKDGVLYSQFGPKIMQTTMFGEINGQVTERVKGLASLFETSKLPYTVEKDMLSFLISHSVVNIAMITNLYTGTKMMDQSTAKTKQTAQNMSKDLKKYLKATEKAGFNITPSMLKLVLKCPNGIMDLIIMKIMGTKLVGDILFNDYNANANVEIVQLQQDFVKLLKQKGITV